MYLSSNNQQKVRGGGKQKVIKINVDLGLGKYSKTVFGNDLT